MFMLTSTDIRDLRLALNLSPTEFAAKLKVSENAVRRWEMPADNQYARFPSGKNLVKLLELREKTLASK